jgi:hypothetical protein
MDTGYPNYTGSNNQQPEAGRIMQARVLPGIDPRAGASAHGEEFESSAG